MDISNSSPVTTLANLKPGVSPAEVTERQQVVQAMSAVNQMTVFGENRELTFTFDRATHRMVIHVIDRETHETVMQMPSEELLRLLATLQAGS